MPSKSPVSTFSHHEASGWSTIATVLLAMVLLEGGLIHLWLAHSGYTTATWVASGLHFVAAVWIALDAWALAAKRTQVHPPSNGASSVVEVRVGLRARARFARTQVTDVQLGAFDTCESSEQLVRIAGPVNVRLAFEAPVQIHTLWRSPRPITALLLQVDEPDAFQRALLAPLE